MTNLERLILNISSKRVFIQTHNFPDPDAIGCGYGLQYLLALRGIEAVICYGGAIDRMNTLKMTELFHIDIINLKDIMYMGSCDEIILVDTQNIRGNMDESIGKVVGCIDHHPVFQEWDYKFSDIREKTGACSSIIASYFFEDNVEMPGNVAEVLLYGIKMDTANLTRGVTQLDLDMFYRLYSIAEKDNLDYLENNAIQADDLHVYANAINSVKIYDNVSFAYTGADCSRSLIGAISDFTLKIADVFFTVVYSTREDGIRISVRSSSKQLNAGEIIIKALEGIGTGGGHSSMAGGFVPFKNRQESVWRNMIKTIEKRTMEAIKKASNRNRTDN